MSERVCIHIRARDCKSVPSCRNRSAIYGSADCAEGRRFGNSLTAKICVNLWNLRTNHTELMIIYSVTITLQASIESDWVEWMKSVHIPEVLRTGCFSDCRIYK